MAYRDPYYALIWAVSAGHGPDWLWTLGGRSGYHCEHKPILKSAAEAHLYSLEFTQGPNMDWSRKQRHVNLVCM